MKSVGSRISSGGLFSPAGVLRNFRHLLFAHDIGQRGRIDLERSHEHHDLAYGSCRLVVVALLRRAVVPGGIITSLFTVGENKVEAMVYGVLMWALVMGVLIVMGGLGVRSGFNAMMGMAYYSHDSASASNWEAKARDAGVPADQIDAWRRAAKAPSVPEPMDRKTIEEEVTRFTWYAFFGTWISMLAACGLELWRGAGPTFRVVVIQNPSRVMPG